MLTKEQEQSLINFIKLLKSIRNLIIVNEQRLPPNEVMSLLALISTTPSRDVKSILSIAKDILNFSNYHFYLEDGWFHHKTSSLGLVKALIEIPLVKYLALGGWWSRVLKGLWSTYSNLNELSSDDWLRPILKLNSSTEADFSILYKAGALDEFIQIVEKAFLLLQDKNVFAFLTTPDVLYYLIIKMNLEKSYIKDFFEDDRPSEIKQILTLKDVTEADLVYGTRNIPEQLTTSLKKILADSIFLQFAQIVLSDFASMLAKIKVKLMVYFEIEKPINNTTNPAEQKNIIENFKKTIPTRVQNLLNQFKSFQTVKIGITRSYLKWMIKKKDSLPLVLNIFINLKATKTPNVILSSSEIHELYNNASDEEIALHHGYFSTNDIEEKMWIWGKVYNFKNGDLTNLFQAELKNIFAVDLVNGFVDDNLRVDTPNPTLEQRLTKVVEFNHARQTVFQRKIQLAQVVGLTELQMHGVLDERIRFLFGLGLKNFLYGVLVNPLQEVKSHSERKDFYEYGKKLYLERLEMVKKVLISLNVIDNLETDIYNDVIKNALNKIIAHRYRIDSGFSVPKDYKNNTIEHNIEIYRTIIDNIKIFADELVILAGLIKISKINLQVDLFEIDSFRNLKKHIENEIEKNQPSSSVGKLWAPIKDSLTTMSAASQNSTQTNPVNNINQSSKTVSNKK